MKKLLYVVPLVFTLYACGDEADKEVTENVAAKQELKENKPLEEKLSIAEKTEWVVDERLQEPTEDTICYMCNMKVYTRDYEQGVFSAQAIRKNGEVVFYDDIGCLLNDEYVNKVGNEKFVRDYHTLNWINVEEAYAVKTDLKSPMNWGYIFFKFEKDANAYIAEHEHASKATTDEIRAQAIERHKKKQINSDEGHNQGQDNSNEENSSSDGHNENMSSDKSHE